MICFYLAQVDTTKEQKENNMDKERKYTQVEERLIDVIDNFILWYTTEENRALAEEYLANEHVNYNDWFELKKDFIGYHKLNNKGEQNEK